MAIKVFRSSLLSSGAQLLNKSLGLISTLILARLLTPSDFALIALISIVLYFFDILSNSGSEQYIIQKQRLSKDDLNTAWTLDLCIKLGMCLTLILFAPIVVIALDKPEIEDGLQWASLILVFNAAKQPRLMMLKRQLNYRLLFRINLIQKLIAFAVVLLLAYFLKSFWAFVVADIVAAAFLCVVSYICLPSLPTLTLAKVKSQWQFSKWLLGKNILGYIRSQIDTLFVSKFFNNQLLGNYHMAREVAMLPAHHFLAPAIEPLLASFKDNKNNIVQLAVQFNKALLVLSLVAVPICIFTMFYGELIVEVLLGNQWQSAGGLLSVFSMLFVYWVYLLLLEAVLTALGKVKLLFVIDMLSLVVTCLSLSVAVSVSQDINDLALVRAVTGVSLTIFMLIWVTALLKANFFKLMSTVVWPVIPAGIGVYLLSFIDLPTIAPFMQFLVYGTVYCVIVLLLIFSILILRRDNEESTFVLKLIRIVK